MKKFFIGVGGALFGGVVLAKVGVWFAHFQLFLAGFMFDTSGWESDDRLMYVLSMFVLGLLIFCVVMACFEETEKKAE